MKNSYLFIELLKSFTKQEREGFLQFISCKHFNSNKEIINLLNLLLTGIERNNLNDLFKSEENIEKKEKNKLRVRMSLLMKLAKEFLMIQELKEDEKTQFELLQTQLMAKRQFRVYEQHVNRCKKKLIAQKKGIDFYAFQHSLESSLLDFSQVKGELIKESNIALVKKLKVLNFVLNHLSLHLVELSLSEKTNPSKINRSIFNALHPLINLPQFLNHPLIELYHSVIQLLEEKSENAYLEVIKNLTIHSKDIPRVTLINFYTSANNFCIIQIRNKKENYRHHQFDLYKIMEEKGLLVYDNKINAGILKNIIDSSCKINRYNWAEQILNKYYIYVEKRIRNDVKSFNLAIIAFFKKEYQLAIDYLNPLPFINLGYEINRRIILFKCHYETDEYYLIPRATQFRSFEKYISSHKSITKANKTSYKNFITILINLYRVKHKNWGIGENKPINKILMALIVLNFQFPSEPAQYLASINGSSSF